MTFPQVLQDWLFQPIPFVAFMAFILFCLRFLATRINGDLQIRTANALATRKQVLARLQLTAQPAPRGLETLASGLRDGRQIGLHIYLLRPSEPWTWHQSLSLSGAPSTLTLAPHDEPPGDRPSTTAPITGDLKLEHVTNIVERQICAATLCLHAGAREALLALTAHWSVRLRDGVLTASKAGALISADEAERLLEQLITLVELLQPPETPLQGLERALTDPTARVRRRALSRAWELLPPAEARALGERAAADPDPIVAGISALLRGDTAAITAMPPDALLSTANYAAPELVGTLEEASAEPSLIALLDYPDAPVAALAASALAEVGTAEAVPALRKLADGLLTDKRIELAATDALAKIRGRVQPDGEGGLTLVERAAEAGALSTAPSSGALSLARPPRQTTS